MTPAARVAAAIDILDLVLSDQPVEKCLTGWGRSNRYAGSSDRAAIRDHVFGALRRKRSSAWLGGGDTGRAMMIGWLRASGEDCNTLFTGDKYAPEPLNADESLTHDIAPAPRGVRLDCPDWLLEHFDDALGEQANEVLQDMQNRAAVFLRVNMAKSDPESARAALALDGIETTGHPLAKTALEVLQNPRRVRQNVAYIDGLVELQDAGSQAVVEELPLIKGMSVLDYCAGGGGKSLAMVVHEEIAVTACDIDEKRMNDLPSRAARAGADIEIISTDELAGRQFDLVLCDTPCSGSGAWKRSPDAKWGLTSQRLGELVDTQAEILDRVVELSGLSGAIAYVTCSVFRVENQTQIDRFLTRHKAWYVVQKRQISPLEGGDGFFVAILKRKDIA